MTKLAAYTADEASGAVIDVTGNGHDFTPVGNTQRTAAGGGYTHGGSTPNSKGLTQSSTGTDAGPALFGQTTQRTLAMWLKTTADFTGWAWEWQLTSVPTGVWGLLCLSGSIGFRGRNTGGTTAFASRTRPTDNAWHHYAGTFDGTSVRLYFDGVLSGSPVALSGGIATNANALNVFDVTLGTPPTIDDPQIFDEALDAAAITALMAVPPGAAAPLGPALETDTAQPAGRTRITVAGPAFEVDAGVLIGRTRITPAGPALELDTGQPIGSIHTTPTTPALETDQALSAARSRVHTLGTAVETDSAQTPATTRTTPAGPALESDQAQPAGNPNEVLRDLDLRALVEPPRLLVVVEADRFRTETER